MAFTGKKLLTDSRKRVLLESKLQVLSRNGHIKKKTTNLKKTAYRKSQSSPRLDENEGIYFFFFFACVCTHISVRVNKF